MAVDVEVFFIEGFGHSIRPEYVPVIDTMDRSVCLDSIEKAWASRFHRWKGYAISLTGSVTDAEEVVQEAVARTIRANPDLATEADAHYYILAAVRSVAMSLFDRRRRLSPFEEQAPIPRKDVASNPLRRLLRREAEGHKQALAEKAYDAMEALDPKLKQIVELIVLREPPLKLREVAAIQDAPISTVHSRLQSALGKLGREVGDDER